MARSHRLLAFMIPTWTGKPGKMGKLFPVREKLGNFEQTGKVKEFYPKYWKIEGISPKYWKTERILASFYSIFFSNFLIEVYLLNRFLHLLNSLNETLIKYWKMEKNTEKIREKSGNFVSFKMWEPWR